MRALEIYKTIHEGVQLKTKGKQNSKNQQPSRREVINTFLEGRCQETITSTWC